MCKWLSMKKNIHAQMWAVFLDMMVPLKINHIRYSHELPVTYVCQPRLNQTFIIIIIIALVIITLSSPKGNDLSFFSQTNTHQLTPLYHYLAMLRYSCPYTAVIYIITSVPRPYLVMSRTLCVPLQLHRNVALNCVHLHSSMTLIVSLHNNVTLFLKTQGVTMFIGSTSCLTPLSKCNYMQ